MPQLRHIDPEIMEFVSVSRTPDFGQEMSMGQHHSGVANELREQFEFDRSQMNL